ncbi:drug facilitator PEP5 [Fusarium subglutinans]|uniref:Drug facilitator PEP5 n=1 Tax=Gibberella subglutinans TaxID=42677 RepID=A0A8H5NWV1_GIBSU|nr:drug facilitator PEP5 [Fusarium subglutinans]KAF5579878.1 drug facilitator PEP5 [Fusarium subglutinans]
MAASQFATPTELIALTSSMMICVRSLGGSIGLAINNAVLHSALDKELPKVVAAALPLGLPASSLGDLIQALASQNKQAIATVPGITLQIAEAVVRGMKRAYVVAFRNSWIVSAAFSALLVITCLFIKEQAEAFDKRIDAPVESGSQGFYDEEKNREATVQVSHGENV